MVFFVCQGQFSAVPGKMCTVNKKNNNYVSKDSEV